ncbi:MAG: 5-dehydro-4-deoxy-D-glucuronate isomerase [Ichthyobacteriaceae bacterium]|nr:5-dehydro-4-deoxy-D-glucuronate isomerase [Ichthyobacteriaceae bacterium]
MAVTHEIRYNSHPEDFKGYDTTRLRKEFLIQDLFEEGNIKLVYSMIDRYIVGGAKPKAGEKMLLETIDPLKAEYFLERRELGVICVGGKGKVTVDGTVYDMNYKDALYVGRGAKEVYFEGDDALFYINSAPAHKQCPTKQVTLGDANVLHLGSLETSNHRDVNQMLINGIVETCQLQMGMTELKPGSVWNTMPAHTHSRRMEAYFYFEVPTEQAVCHFMGQPQETRHIWMQNHEAVLSPDWSIHSAAGTSNYIFIWGMAGENLDYADMDIHKITDLK